MLRAFRPDDVASWCTSTAAGSTRCSTRGSAQTGKGLVDGGLRFEGTQVVEIQPKSGVGIERDDAEDRAIAALAHRPRRLGTLADRPDHARGRRRRGRRRGARGAPAARVAGADRRRHDHRSCSVRRSWHRRCGPRSSTRGSCSASIPPRCAPRSPPGSPPSRPRRRTRASRSRERASRSSRRSPARPWISTASASTIARGRHHVTATSRDHAAGPHHRVGAEAQHHRARVELHDRAPVLPAAGHEHPPRRRHHQRHDRRAGPDLLSQRRARSAHDRQGLRARTRHRRRPRVRGLGRRRREPGLDHALQRDVLRLLRGRHPHGARALHLALPDGPRSDAELPVDRQPVPQRLALGRADPHVLQRHVRHRRALRQQGGPDAAGPRARTSSRRSRSSPSTSTTRRCRPAPRRRPRTGTPATSSRTSASSTVRASPTSASASSSTTRWRRTRSPEERAHHRPPRRPSRRRRHPPPVRRPCRPRADDMPTSRPTGTRAASRSPDTSLTPGPSRGATMSRYPPHQGVIMKRTSTLRRMLGTGLGAVVLGATVVAMAAPAGAADAPGATGGARRAPRAPDHRAEAVPGRSRRHPPDPAAHGGEAQDPEGRGDGV